MFWDCGKLIQTQGETCKQCCPQYQLWVKYSILCIVWFFCFLHSVNPPHSKAALVRVHGLQWHANLHSHRSGRLKEVPQTRAYCQSRGGKGTNKTRYQRGNTTTQTLWIHIQAFETLGRVVACSFRRSHHCRLRSDSQREQEQERERGERIIWIEITFYNLFFSFCMWIFSPFWKWDVSQLIAKWPRVGEWKWNNKK